MKYILPQQHFNNRIQVHPSQRQPWVEPVSSPLYVITAITNPQRFQSRYRLYQAFEKYVEDSGGILYTIELALRDRHHEITSADNPRHIQLRSPDELWYKENLLNIALRSLPPSWEYVSWCFTGDSLVETSEGLKRIDAINEGDLVKSHDGSHQRVIQVMKRNYPQKHPLLYVKTKYSSTKCTPEHPFYVLRDGCKIWLKAEDICNSDMLLYPMKPDSDVLEFGVYANSSSNGSGRTVGHKKMSVIIDKIDVDEDFARFMGLFLAEGSASGDSIGFTFHNDESNLHELIERICLERFNRNVSKCIRWSTTLRLHIKSLVPLFREWFGSCSSERKVPDFVFDWSFKNKLAFIHGFLEGDGCKDEDGRFSCVEVSSVLLLEGFVKLLKDTGLLFNPEIKSRERNTSFCNHLQTHYRISLSKIASDKMMDLREAKFIDDEYVGIPVSEVLHKKMYRANYEDGNVVYNLEVENTHTYIVNSASVHNCDADVSFARPDWVVETIHQLQHFKVVQMFSHAIDLGPRYEPMVTYTGFGYCYNKASKEEISKYGGSTYWHPGYAWAARRSAINDVGGFGDIGIVGSGDYSMACALIGQVEKSLRPEYSKEYKNYWLRWQAKAEKSIQRSLGYVPGTLLHTWHGKKANRKYNIRDSILIDNAFNPTTDIVKDVQGLWQLTGNKFELRDQLKNYFTQRNEDGNEL